jgi:hypothetical protein
MQRRCKHAFSTVESLWFLRGLCKVVVKKISFERSPVDSSFETPACQDMRQGAEELNWVESSELAVAE